MRKIVLVLCTAAVLVTSAYSIDTEKAKKAITEYSYVNRETYIPVLLDYGFTERQLKAWIVAGTYIGFYIQELAGLLDGYGEPNPDRAITTIRNNSVTFGEISARDMDKIALFIKDMTAVAIQLRDTARAEHEAGQRQLAESAQQHAEQQRTAEEQLKAEHQRAMAAQAEQQRDSAQPEQRVSLVQPN
jgi:hypothetical protein